MKKFKILITACILLPLTAGVSFASGMTLEECISIAVKQHPSLEAAAAKVNALKAAENQEAADGRPQAGMSAKYGRGGGSAEGVEDSDSYNADITLKQSLYDWGRRELRVKGAKMNTGAAESDYSAKRDKVVADVRTAFYGMNRAERDRLIALERYENYKKRLSWAKAFYEVGTKPKIEVTKAESDLASSKLTVVEAEAAVEQSKAELASAMGLPLAEIKKTEDVLDNEDRIFPIDEAVKRAMAEKPEIKSQKQKVEFRRTYLELMKKGLAPELNASAGYSYYGRNDAFEESGWNAGVTLSVPLTDGGLTKSRISGAKEALAGETASLREIENKVKLSVRKSWYAFYEACEMLTASQEAQRAARESLDLANSRYEAGVGNSLEISDAVDSYARAQKNVVTALHKCKQSYLELELSVGGLE